MRRVLTVTKTTRVLRVKELLADLLGDVVDELILMKHRITLKQLEKIYSKLYYGGYLSRDDLERRVHLRQGRDASHIPFAEMEERGTLYQCGICGFVSPLHFSTCPRCREINLRRLTRRIPQTSASSGGLQKSAY
jgi:hypothetical protein